MGLRRSRDCFEGELGSDWGDVFHGGVVRRGEKEAEGPPRAARMSADPEDDVDALFPCTSPLMFFFFLFNTRVQVNPMARPWAEPLRPSARPKPTDVARMAALVPTPHCPPDHHSGFPHSEGGGGDDFGMLITVACTGTVLEGDRRGRD